MRQNYDTVIIGGGPAGMACAITLQKRGVSCCVLEREAFPRNKSCAGLLTEKSVALLMQLFDAADTESIRHLFRTETNEVMLYNGTEPLVSTNLATKLRITQRRSFDCELAKYYRSLGGELRENTCRYRINYQKSLITLEDGSEIKYAHLVGADGACSRIRHHFGLRDPLTGFSAETFVPKTAVKHPDILSLHLGTVEGGYRWVFPSGDQFCIGVINHYSRETDYRREMKAFLKELGVKEAYPIKGAFIPYGRSVDQSKTPRNLLLVGDAGGLVDPIWGEGIYPALFSGIQAAETIAAGEKKGDYLARIETLTRSVFEGYFVQQRLFSLDYQKKFLLFARGQKGFLRFYCDHQLAWAEYPYSELRTMAKDYFLKRKR